MPADYKSMGMAPEKKSIPGFVWLLGGLLIGLFVALLIHLDKQPANDVNFSEAVQVELDKLKQNATTAKKSPPAESVPVEKKTEPRFNFYTILPEMEVFIPDFELNFSDNEKSAEELLPNDTGKSYTLQAGSFKNKSDAERLKASLALLGLEASLQSVTVNKQQWHRVRTGPYNSTKALYHSLNLLKQNGITAMPLETKPD